MYERSSIKNISIMQRLAGWLIHLFTASGACIGLFSLLAIYQHKELQAFWLWGAAIFIDGVDGWFARLIRIKEAVPRIDGELLDNIVDFFNYTLVPCFFLLVTDLMPMRARLFCVTIIIFSSAYQFCQIDAKTSDHFFKGFPSYWNITIFYLFLLKIGTVTNISILMVLAILSFIPIKYVYPSRLDFLTDNLRLRISMLIFTLLWGGATAGLLWIYPKTNLFLVVISVGYALFYFGISFYRTYFPLVSLVVGQNESCKEY